MNLDSHQHFWKYDPTKHVWITNDMSILKKDYLPKDLEKEFKTSNIQGSVAVQASQSEDETIFLTDLANEHHSIKAIVGWVNLSANNTSERLAYFVDKSPKIKGFRHVIHDEPDAHFMLRKNFQHGISLLNAYNLTYDLLIYPEHLEPSIKLVKSFPNQKFIIDHIAKPDMKNGNIDRWKRQMQKLGQYDNVWCKLSGMVTETHWHEWKYDDFVPFLDVVLDAFGTNRLLFGSDWPVCLLSGSYDEVKSIITEYISELTTSEQNKIMGDNAIKFYDIDASFLNKL